MDNETYRAVGLAEGFVHSDDEEEILGAWQHLINTGVVWQLQGSFGRMANQLIEAGACQTAQNA